MESGEEGSSDIVGIESDGNRGAKAVVSAGGEEEFGISECDDAVVVE